MIRTLLHRLARDNRGSTVIEFALLAPVIFSMMFGVIQVGISMQAYNALRSISSETARHALIKFERKELAFMDPVTVNASIEAEAELIAESAPYMMLANFDATVTDAASPVQGAIKKNLTVTYTPPTVLPFFNFASSQLSFTRPIFVIDE